MKVLINLKKQGRKAKGISLISLVIAVLVLMILTNIIIYSAKDNLKIEKLKGMQNDIKNLRDKVSSFYATNGKIPAKLVYDNQEAIEKIKEAGVISNKVDTGKFLVIDLSALENLTLNRGQDYKKVKDFANLTEEAKQWTDLYIINEASHNIFYVAGITIDDETFYTDYGADEVDNASVNLRYVDNVRIPEGFYYAGGSKAEGLVISDVPGDDLDNSMHGNQFVWVPVEKIEDFHLIEGYENNSKQNYLIGSVEPNTSGYSGEVEDYMTMKKSVEANKGFYIDRFETGKDNYENAIVQKNADVYSAPWGNSITDASGGAVEKAKNYTVGKTSYNSSVTSTLCYGVQWDATIQFMDNNYISGNCDTNSYVINSIGKGWYSDNYATGNPNHKTGIDVDSNKSNCVKNIYDMAGNLTEWTLETYGGSVKIYRGGSYSAVGTARPSSHRAGNYPHLQNAVSGFRIALYLNENEEDNWTPAYDKQGAYKDKNGDTAYIPKGFQVSKKSGEDTIDEGLVVRDSNKNEFVWIPVDDISQFKTRAGYERGTLQTLNCTEPYANGYETERNDYNSMRESIKNKHGFYIGRYEAGKENNKVVIKKDADVYNYVPWGNSMTDINGTNNTNGNTGAVNLAKNFASSNDYNGVTSTLCYSVQWDTALEFIDPEYKGFAKSSEKQGWYNDNYDSKEEGNTAVNPNHKTGIDLIYTDQPNIIANKQKNIYDMAGNVFEWTMEAWNDTYRVYRGGGYSYDYSGAPASRRGGGTPNAFNAIIGFRIALYLEDDEEENWSLVYDKQEAYQDKNGNTAYIPKGFQVSNKEGENTINEGLVIRDTNKNEFVWVPVNNINDFHTIEGYQSGALQNELSNCVEPYTKGYATEVTDYEAMKNSVINHKGFYIGRYEAGKEGNKVVIKKGASCYCALPWGNSMTDIEGVTNTNGKTGAVKLAKEFAENNNDITSTLIYGVQWDAALKFIDPNYTGFAINSSKQGWHGDNLNNTTGGNITINPNRITGLDLIYSEKPNVIANKQKNIYDMAGNLFEWTMEASGTDKRCYRGAAYYSNGSVSPASVRGKNITTLSSAEMGFRIALYLQ